MKKKSERKKGKREIFIILFMIFFTLLILSLFSSLVSAGILDFIKQTITGKATSSQVSMNITVGGPRIITVFNESLGGVINVDEGPLSTSTVINFSVYIPTGTGNLNHSTARLNFTRTGEDLRQNLSCKNIDSVGNYANYSCNLDLWWWDGAGTWNISAYIEDNNSNSAQNSSTSIYVMATTSFVSGPSALSWQNLAPGSTNQTPSNQPVLMNNTGNVVISSSELQVNSTNLRGEEDNSYGLWGGNFSASWNTGGTPPAECSGTTMNASVFKSIAIANLTKGNFSINNGDTGQEELYFCLKIIGSELTDQSYSTSQEGTWTLKIA